MCDSDLYMFGIIRYRNSVLFCSIPHVVSAVGHHRTGCPSVVGPSACRWVEPVFCSVINLKVEL